MVNSVKNDYFKNDDNGMFNVNDPELIMLQESESLSWNAIGGAKENNDMFNFDLLDDDIDPIISANEVYEDIQEHKFEKIVDIKIASKTDEYYYNELVEELETKFKDKRAREKISSNFYDLDNNSGLIQIYEQSLINKQIKEATSFTPLVQSMLGDVNSGNKVLNAKLNASFIPIFSEKMVQYKPVVSNNTIYYDKPLLDIKENDFTLIDDLKKLYEPLQYVSNSEEPGINILFSKDIDVFNVAMYKGDNDIHIHKLINSENRLVYNVSKKPENYSIRDPEFHKLVGVYDTKNTKIHMFKEVNNVVEYARYLDDIVPSVATILMGSNINGISQAKFELNHYMWDLDDISHQMYNSLKTRLAMVFDKSFHNQYKTLRVTKLSKNLVNDYESSVLLNDEKLKFFENYYGTYGFKKYDSLTRRFLWVKTKHDNGDVMVNSKNIRNFLVMSKINSMNYHNKSINYQINQPESIHSKILKNETDNYRRDILIKNYIKHHGTESTINFNIVDHSGSFICCIHENARLMKDYTNEQIISEFGEYYQYSSSYLCKYCGTILETTYEDGVQFDENNNIIVMHDQIIEQNEAVNTEKLIVSDMRNEDMRYFIEFATNLGNKLNKDEKNIFHENSTKNLFINELKSYEAVFYQLINPFNYISYEKELNDYAKKIRNNLMVKNPGINFKLASFEKENYVNYCTSLLCFRLGIYIATYAFSILITNKKYLDIKIDDYINYWIKKIKNYYKDIYEYINSNMGINAYSDYLKEYRKIFNKNVVPVEPFNTTNMKVVNHFDDVIYNGFKKVYDNNQEQINIAYKEAAEVIQEKQIDANMYGFVLDHVKNIVAIPSSSVSNLYDISQNLSFIGGVYANFLKENVMQYQDISSKILISIDISDMVDNSPRKELTIKKYKNIMSNLLTTPELETYKILESTTNNNSKKYKKFITSSYEKHGSNVDTKYLNVVDPVYMNKNYNNKVIQAKTFKKKNKETNVYSCVPEEFVKTISEFIETHAKQYYYDSFEDVDMFYYWFNDDSFNSKFENFVYMLDNIDDKMINEYNVNIEKSENIKIRKFADYYIKQQNDSLNASLKRDLVHYLNSYLRSTVTRFVQFDSNSNNTEVSSFLYDSEFKEYKYYDKTPITVCSILEEVIENIQNLKNIKHKYAVLLLMVFYNITLAMKARDTTQKSINILYSEYVRKQNVNLKNANDRRNARDNVQETETNNEVPVMESLENTPVEIFKDDSFDEYNY